MSTVKISKEILRQEIMKSLKPMLEGHGGHGSGCGCSKCGGAHEMDHHEEMDGGDMMSHSDDPIGSLSKDEAMDLVSMIAARTSCPMTRAALEDVVDDLEPAGMRDDHGMTVIPMDGMGHDEEMGYMPGMIGLGEARNKIRLAILKEIYSMNKG